MTTLVVILIGAGALLLVSGIEGTSLADTFKSLWGNTVPKASGTPGGSTTTHVD